MYLILALVAIVAIWSLWGYMSSRTERAEYSVVKSGKEYEIRRYPSHIVAQTVVRGPYQRALKQGFRIVAGYIFGGNTKKERIAMTAPVVERAASEPIAMTAPVIASIEGESHTIAFGMPRSYSLATLPVPTDPRVQIVTVPEQKMAVIRFSWLPTSSRVEAKKQELLEALRRDALTPRGDPQYAGYDAPWTPPWMTRHEVMVAVQ
jgi:effector-binding domain-containing protein